MPESIINYVIRTKKNIILENPAHQGNFTQYHYIKSVKPLFLLCYGLLNQGNLVGIIYLENSLTTEAFPPNQIEFLQLISTQAVISITNAQLYAQLREREQQLQQFLEAIPVGIGIVDAQGYPYYANQKGRWGDWLSVSLG